MGDDVTEKGNDSTLCCGWERTSACVYFRPSNERSLRVLFGTKRSASTGREV